MHPQNAHSPGVIDTSIQIRWICACSSTASLQSPSALLLLTHGFALFLFCLPLLLAVLCKHLPLLPGNPQCPHQEHHFRALARLPNLDTRTVLGADHSRAYRSSLLVSDVSFSPLKHSYTIPSAYGYCLLNISSLLVSMGSDTIPSLPPITSFSVSHPDKK